MGAERAELTMKNGKGKIAGTKQPAMLLPLRQTRGPEMHGLCGTLSFPNRKAVVSSHGDNLEPSQVYAVLSPTLRPRHRNGALKTNGRKGREARTDQGSAPQGALCALEDSFPEHYSLSP